MKTIKKLSYTLVLVLTAAALITSCQSRAEKERLEKEKTMFEEARNETTAKLEEWRDDIDYRINDINRRLEDASDEMKDGLQAAKEALTKERSDIDRVLNDVKNATQETWDDVSKFTEETYDKTKRKAEEIAKDIEEWFEK
ncbi:MAG: hypothetical protein R6W67_10220 [Bacteroidales bacterium]